MVRRSFSTRGAHLLARNGSGFLSLSGGFRLENVFVRAAEVFMLRTSLLLVAVVYLAITTVTAQSATGQVLPGGMLLQCTLDEPHFSSSTAEIGDPILCHIAGLGAFGQSVFPRGAYLAGRFQDFRDPGRLSGRLFGKGWMELTFDRLVLPAALTLPLSAKIISAPHLRVDREGRIHGLGHPKLDAVGWAIPILWPIKLLTLPARGPRPTLKGEVRITLRLMEDLEIPPVVVASRSSSPPVQAFVPSSDTNVPRLWSIPDNSGTQTSPAITTSESVKVLGVIPFAERFSGHQLTVLLFKDDTGYLATDYWLEGTKLHCLTWDGEHKVMPLGRLDLDETVRVNRERNVEIVLRSEENRQY